MEAQGKIGLSVLETGWLLQKSEAQVRGMLKRGELSYAVGRRLLAIKDVERLIETPLATVCLLWLRLGLIEAPRPPERWGQPVSLVASLKQILLVATSPLLAETARIAALVPPPSHEYSVMLDRTKCSLDPGDSFPSDLENSINSTSSLLCVL